MVAGLDIMAKGGWANTMVETVALPGEPFKFRQALVLGPNEPHFVFLVWLSSSLLASYPNTKFGHVKRLNPVAYKLIGRHLLGTSGKFRNNTVTTPRRNFFYCGMFHNVDY